MIRKNLLIDGRVQGVGFRFFVKFNAMPLNLTGFAKNLDDGNVLAQVQGESEKIDSLIQLLYKGNGFCKVKSISHSDIDLVINETGFNIH